MRRRGRRRRVRVADRRANTATVANRAPVEVVTSVALFSTVVSSFTVALSAILSEADPRGTGSSIDSTVAFLTTVERSVPPNSATVAFSTSVAFSATVAPAAAVAFSATVAPGSSVAPTATGAVSSTVALFFEGTDRPAGAGNSPACGGAVRCVTASTQSELISISARSTAKLSLCRDLAALRDFIRSSLDKEFNQAAVILGRPGAGIVFPNGLLRRRGVA